VITNAVISVRHPFVMQEQTASPIYSNKDPVRTLSLSLLISTGLVQNMTALQAGSSRVRFPKLSLKFFTDIIFPVALGPWGPLTEMSTMNIFGEGVKVAGA
jgi:hypothetical protein